MIGQAYHYDPYSMALLPDQEVQSIDIFKKRDLLRVQLNHLPPDATEDRAALSEELAKMIKLIEALPSWRMPLADGL